MNQYNQTNAGLLSYLEPSLLANILATSKGVKPPLFLQWMFAPNSIRRFKIFTWFFCAALWSGVVPWLFELKQGKEKIEKKLLYIKKQTWQWGIRNLLCNQLFLGSIPHYTGKYEKGKMKEGSWGEQSVNIGKLFLVRRL